MMLKMGKKLANWSDDFPRGARVTEIHREKNGETMFRPAFHTQWFSIARITNSIG